MLYSEKDQLIIVIMIGIFRLLFLCISLYNTDAVSCQIGGRGACIASCQVQNCGSGYCTEGNTGICVCMRCGNGPPW